MFKLNENELLCLKYMVLSTGLLNREYLIGIEDISSLFNELKKESGSDELENECLYYLAFYNLLHRNHSCPSEYTDKKFGENISDASILFLRLFQNLSTSEFFEVLQSCMAVSETDFRDLQIDFNQLEIAECLPKIENWLLNKDNPFVDDIRLLISERAGESATLEISLDANNSLPTTIITGNSQPTTDIEDNQLPTIDKKGICLIVNNEHFRRQLPRPGTIKDGELIRETFSKLGFDVRAEHDFTYPKMKKILEDIKSDIKSNHKMFVAFFLSHGKEENLIMSDEKYYPFEEIWEPFKGSQCSILIGKPKLFFFVCCQGNNINQAVTKPKLESDGINLEVDGIESYPDVADFFFGYSTLKSFYSYRHPRGGTSYVKYLCEEINTNPTRCITVIHTAVQNKLASTPIPHGFQMPSYKSVLTKSCFLA